MKHINLLPHEDTGPALGRRELLGFAGVALLVLAVLAHVAWLQGSLAWRGREVATLESEYARLEAELAPLREAAASEAKRQQRYASIRKILSRKNGWSETFREFSGALPKGVWLTGLASSRAEGALRFLVRGESRSNRKVASFLSHLEELPTVSSATLNFSQREASLSPQVYRFEMNVPLSVKEAQP